MPSGLMISPVRADAHQSNMDVYDDETGQWIEQDDGDESFLELELAWVQESDLLAMLEQRSSPFSRTEAFSLCAEVILYDFSSNVLSALLDVCPPLEEFLDAGRVDCPVPEFWDPLGLTELAAYLGREELLETLRGGVKTYGSGAER